jgi:hypothetical protein
MLRLGSGKSPLSVDSRSVLTDAKLSGRSPHLPVAMRDRLGEWPAPRRGQRCQGTGVETGLAACVVYRGGAAIRRPGWEAYGGVRKPATTGSSRRGPARLSWGQARASTTPSLRSATTLAAPSADHWGVSCSGFGGGPEASMMVLAEGRTTVDECAQEVSGRVAPASGPVGVRVGPAGRPCRPGPWGALKGSMANAPPPSCWRPPRHTAHRGCPRITRSTSGRPPEVLFVTPVARGVSEANEPGGSRATATTRGGMCRRDR